MRDRFVDIETADGKMPTFVTHPEAGGPFPAVVLYMDIWGVREELYDIARYVGSVGYYVLVPDLLYRQGEIRHEYRNELGQTITMERLPEEERLKIRTPVIRHSDALTVADTGALIDFLGRGEPAKPGAMGCFGYCLGGRMVLAVAGAFPQHFVATASIHGVGMVTDRDDSPHRQAPNFRGELYCGWAQHDPNARIKDQFEAALDGKPVTYHNNWHVDAYHGYALPQRDVHDKHANARDWEAIFAMFHRQMPA